MGERKAETYEWKPCRNCGGTERYVRNRHCVTCSSARCKAHRVANRDKLNAQKKAYQIANREKLRAQAKAYRVENLEKVRARQRSSQLKYNYGITAKEYDEMWEDQCGRCASCHRRLIPGKDTHVDHCHETGKVRGLLHHKCNMLLGLVIDDPFLLECAAEYLRQCESPKAVKQRNFKQSIVTRGVH